MSGRGFSLVELLVATTVCALLAGALAGVVPAAMDAFVRVPAVVDAQQGARTAVDTVSAAIRSAGADVAATRNSGGLAAALPAVLVLEPSPVDAAAPFAAIYTVAPVVNAAQGRLAQDQSGPGGPLTLADGPGCPAVADVCGFLPGMTAVVADGTGRFDVFTVASTDAGLGALVAEAALAAPYPAGSVVVEVNAALLRLATQPDGTRSLVRESTAGAVQPIVDFVTGWGVAAYAGRPPVFVPPEVLQDGPFLPGGPDGAYDADALAIRRIDFWIAVSPPSPLRQLPPATMRASVTLRGAP